MALHCAARCTQPTAVFAIATADPRAHRQLLSSAPPRHGERGHTSALVASMPLLPERRARPGQGHRGVELLWRKGAGPSASCPRRAAGNAHPRRTRSSRPSTARPRTASPCSTTCSPLVVPVSRPLRAHGAVLAGHGVEVPARVRHVAAGTASTEVLRELQPLAHVRNDFVASVTIGEHLLAASPHVDPWVLYTSPARRALGDTRARASAGGVPRSTRVDRRAPARHRSGPRGALGDARVSARSATDWPFRFETRVFRPSRLARSTPPSSLLRRPAEPLGAGHDLTAPILTKVTTLTAPSLTKVRRH